MKILLVDDEEQILKSVSRIISCEEENWEVEMALSGEAALEILKHEPFDAVVSEVKMTGMDGAELLAQIGQRHPGMIRIVLSGQVDRETVLRAVKPMHQYLSKPCDPERLFHVIRQAEIFQETIKSAEVLDAIGRANCIPSFPEIANEINREIESESGSSKTIAAIISKDPVLCARVLQLANSALFSMRNPVTDIDRSISLVGLDMIRSLALSQSVFSGNEGNDRILSAQNLIDHGIRVAIVGKKLARHVGASVGDGNTIFTAGLLHDVGKMILLNAFPDRYASILKTSRLEGKCLEQLEMETFEATHQGIGGYLFELWGLPAEVIQSVASHHSFYVCARSQSLPRQLVFAANWIVRDRRAADLQKLVDEAENADKAKTFANHIAEWQEFIASSEKEK